LSFPTGAVLMLAGLVMRLLHVDRQLVAVVFLLGLVIQSIWIPRYIAQFRHYNRRL